MRYEWCLQCVLSKKLVIERNGWMLGLLGQWYSNDRPAAAEDTSFASAARNSRIHRNFAVNKAAAKSRIGSDRLPNDEQN